MQKATVTISTHTPDLYVIPEGGGYSCLGFDVLVERYNRLARELQEPDLLPALRGTLEAYALFTALQAIARTSGRRFACELSPQLIGREGRRVEVVTFGGERRRFTVGKSTGWIPIHLEVPNSRSTGGCAAERLYESVREVPGRQGRRGAQ